MAETDGHGDDEHRRLRHDLRGAFNELRLCVEVLRLEAAGEEALEWLAQVERAAEPCEAAVLRLGERGADAPAEKPTQRPRCRRTPTA